MAFICKEIIPIEIILRNIKLRGRMGLRAKSANTLCNKILFTLKIEKNIPNEKGSD